MNLLSQTQEPAPCPREAGHPKEAVYLAPTAEVGKGTTHVEFGWPVGAQGQGLRTCVNGRHWELIWQQALSNIVAYERSSQSENCCCYSPMSQVYSNENKNVEGPREWGDLISVLCLESGCLCGRIYNKGIFSYTQCHPTQDKDDQ